VWRFDKNEYADQGMFHRYADKVIPGCQIVRRKMLQKHQPDAFIELDGELLPVEVKHRAFNKAAQRQLARYMDVYQTARGVAVGESYTGEVPDNIIFVPLSALRKCEEASLEAKEKEKRKSKSSKQSQGTQGWTLQDYMVYMGTHGDEETCAILPQDMVVEMARGYNKLLDDSCALAGVLAGLVYACDAKTVESATKTLSLCTWLADDPDSKLMNADDVEKIANRLLASFEAESKTKKEGKK
jgi:hypothetical protein